MRSAVALVFLVTCLRGVQEPSVRIVSPEPKDFVSGPTEIRLEVVASGDELTAVVVQANGERVCRLVSRPYVCRWDAGAAVRMNQIRAVAEFKSGRRAVDNVRTTPVDASEEVAVESVLVGVSVSDRGGRAVEGLTAGDFSLLVAGRATPITFFGAGQLALDVLVALDISGSMGRHLPEMRRAVRAFTDNLNGRDRLALGGFNTSLFLLAPLAPAGPSHLLAAERISAFGGTALNDALLEGLSALPASTGRRVMIFFTDGLDQLSRSTLQDVERTLLEQNVLLYVVGHGAAHEQPQRDTLTRLCNRTGGRAVLIRDIGSDLRDAFADLVRNIKSQYTLGFNPDPKARGWQTIDVELLRRGFKVRAREGYEAGS